MSLNQIPNGSTVEEFNVGFRVASVPEPSGLVIAGLGGAGVLIGLSHRGKRSRRVLCGARRSVLANLFTTILLMGLTSLTTNLAIAIEYQITDLGNIIAKAINNSGQVVGTREVLFEWEGMQYMTEHAVFYDGTTTHDLTPTPGELGYFGSAANGISDNGLITGYLSAGPPGGYARYAFVGPAGAMQLVDQVESLATYDMIGVAINSSGKGVGSYLDSITENSYAYTGFGFEGATSSRLPTLGGWGASANDINEQGLITGGAEYVALYGYQAYIYDGTTVHDLGTLPNGYRYSEGLAINELGQVTGWAHDAAFARHAFFFDGNSMHDLGTLGGTISQGLDINDHGQIVGDFTDAGGFRHGFLYDPLLGMIELDHLLDPSLGWRISSGVGINNTGQILVDAYKPGERSVSLILTPVPEPAGYLLAALGMLGSTLFVRRRPTSRLRAGQSY